MEVRHPERTFATPDHYVSTLGNELTAISEPYRREMVGALADNARDHGITLFGLGDRRPFRKQLLLSGMDDISLTTTRTVIAAFEARFAKELP